jgi:hypothetical protein
MLGARKLTKLKKKKNCCESGVSHYGMRIFQPCDREWLTRARSRERRTERSWVLVSTGKLNIQSGSKEFSFFGSFFGLDDRPSTSIERSITCTRLQGVTSDRTVRLQYTRSRLSELKDTILISWTCCNRLVDREGMKILFQPKPTDRMLHPW